MFYIVDFEFKEDNILENIKKLFQPYPHTHTHSETRERETKFLNYPVKKCFLRKDLLEIGIEKCVYGGPFKGYEYYD